MQSGRARFRFRSFDDEPRQPRGRTFDDEYYRLPDLGQLLVDDRPPVSSMVLFGAVERVIDFVGESSAGARSLL